MGNIWLPMYLSKENICHSEWRLTLRDCNYAARRKSRGGWEGEKLQFRKGDCSLRGMEMWTQYSPNICHNSLVQHAICKKNGWHWLLWNGGRKSRSCMWRVCLLIAKICLSTCWGLLKGIFSQSLLPLTLLCHGVSRLAKYSVSFRNKAS